MTRNIRVAAAQLGPIQKANSREAVVARMLALMRQAEGCDLIVYPELALTTFFPRWYCADRSEADSWFEREMPGPVTRPLFEAAKRAGDGHELRLCRAHAGRPSFQYVDPGRQGRQHRRQVPQGASARP